MNNKKSKTVVMVHGAWVTASCWDSFKSFFSERGYEVLTPTWPYMDRPIEELRSHPDPEFGGLSTAKIANHYADFISKLPEAPLLIGHSFGGLIVQLLLDQGLGSAGVAINSAPIGGVIPDPVSLMAALPVIARFSGWNKPFVLTKEAFNSKFANTTPAEIQDTEYQRQIVPCPGKIFYQAATWTGTFVNPKRRTVPLLLTSSDQDKTAAPPMIRSIYKKQKKSPARTDLVNFYGKSHFLICEPGWQDVAETVLKWIQNL